MDEELIGERLLIGRVMAIRGAFRAPGTQEAEIRARKCIAPCAASAIARARFRFVQPACGLFFAKIVLTANESHRKAVIRGETLRRAIPLQ
mgnify:CR=1 FL=1